MDAAPTLDPVYPLRADALDPPRAGGPPPVRALFRRCLEDFQVVERLRFQPAGDGSHVYLRLRKRGANTEWVARRIAALARVQARDVGYGGLKDRHAVAEQWFSVPRPAVPPDWLRLADDGIEVLEITRHPRKLRRTGVAANRFRIRLSDVSGDIRALEARAMEIARRGVPNYFGAQRFGRGGGNLDGAARLFDRAVRPRPHLRGLYLSAARAALFNRVLAHRVRAGCWDRPLPGEVLALAGCRSRFRADEVEGGLRARVARYDVHPTGPLWGRGGLRPAGPCAELEGRALAGLDFWQRGLEAAGLEYDRRPLRVVPRAWSLDRQRDGLVLTCELPAGSFATAVLRELAVVTDVAARSGPPV